MPTMQFRQQVLQPLVQNFNLHPDAHAFFIKNQYYTYLQRYNLSVQLYKAILTPTKQK